MSSFERKVLPDGKENPKYVDMLEEDKPISGQKFACISFVSPENILQRREHFFFSEFLRTFEFTKCFEKYTQFLHFLSHKYNLNVETITNDFNEFYSK